MGAAPAGETKLRADANRNRERILAVARAEVAAGDLTLAMNDIARTAGVGVGTVYRHFATRQALLETLVQEHLAELVDLATAALDDPDPWSGVETLFRVAVQQHVQDPGLGRVLAETADANERTTELRAELDHAMDAVLQRAQARGVVRADVTAQDLVRLSCGLDYAARIGRTESESNVTSDVAADLYASIVLAGLRR